MSITVCFTGICTHVTRPGQSGCSVVLVNAENGGYINGKKIPPHIPTLSIEPADILRMEGGMRIDGFPHGLDPTGEEAVWRLGGVRLRLLGTSGEPFRRDSTFDNDIPRLKSTQEAASIPDVSAEVTLNEQAAAYFDVDDHGVMSRETTPHGALYGVWTVETNVTPALEVTCFWNRETMRIHLRPGATININHVGREHGDADSDYLLHYRVLSNVPPDAWVPKKEEGAQKRRPGDISIGCSNSQYP